MTGPLAGKVAVVTGGASGLGAAIAARLAGEGADVVVADVVPAEGPVDARRVDVTREDEVAGLMNSLGRLDVLVLSAAVETRAGVVDTSDEDWQRVLDVNLKGPFLCLKHGVPVMARGGGGSAIALGSVLGSMAGPKYAAYCASKAALVNLCKQAAIEHAPDRVRVNVLAPSACEAGLFMEVTAMAPDPGAVRRMVAERTPMGRLGSVEDVCGAALFLATDASAYISGAVLPLDGGLAARRQS